MKNLVNVDYSFLQIHEVMLNRIVDGSLMVWIPTRILMSSVATCWIENLVIHFCVWTCQLYVPALVALLLSTFTISLENHLHRLLLQSDACIYNRQTALPVGLRIQRLYPLHRIISAPRKRDILWMILIFLWWWGFIF